MARLGRLKSAMKRWSSLSKLGRSNRPREEEGGDRVEGRAATRPVYVGKPRRRYDVSPVVFEHPIFQELLWKSSWWEGGCDEGRLVVECEVVLFEHLVWMLENEGDDDDDDTRLGSMDEFVGFYTCC